MLWVARGEQEDSTDHRLFMGKPWVNSNGDWENGSYSRTILIPASMSPVTLKPGEGPVRVRLALVEEGEKR